MLILSIVYVLNLIGLGAMSSEQTHCFKQTRVFDMWFLQARAQTLANR